MCILVFVTAEAKANTKVGTWMVVVSVENVQKLCFASFSAAMVKYVSEAEEAENQIPLVISIQIHSI